ncbi:MAG: 50S ribosomal protein L9, partial [Alphaproteobacteria bacterium]
TKDNLGAFENRRAQLEAANLKRREEAQAVAAKVDNLSVVVLRQAGETGQLYGSVSSRDIAEAVTAAGLTVERQQVTIEKPIKTLGLHTIRVVLHPEVSIAVTVNVAQSAEEAAAQARGAEPAAGEAPAAEDEEEAAS